MDEKVTNKNSDYKTTATPKATTNDGIPVFCSHDDIIPTANLKENPLNPNKHPEEQIALLADIIERTGWRQPITISNQSRCIVKGHGRLAAALQDYSNKDEEYADLIADNRLAELSEIQNDLIAEIVKDFENPDILALTGYTSDDIDNILAELEADGEEEKGEEEEQPSEKEKTLLTKAGDTWNLGEHRLIVGEDDPFMDNVISNYVYDTGNIGCTCIRDGVEHTYMELITAWAEENNVTEEVFKLRKPTKTGSKKRK